MLEKYLYNERPFAASIQPLGPSRWRPVVVHESSAVCGGLRLFFWLGPPKRNLTQTHFKKGVPKTYTHTFSDCCSFVFPPPRAIARESGDSFRACECSCHQIPCHPWPQFVASFRLFVAFAHLQNWFPMVPPRFLAMALKNTTPVNGQVKPSSPWSHIFEPPLVVSQFKSAHWMRKGKAQH